MTGNLRRTLTKTFRLTMELQIRKIENLNKSKISEDGILYENPMLFVPIYKDLYKFLPAQRKSRTIHTVKKITIILIKQKKQPTDGRVGFET